MIRTNIALNITQQELRKVLAELKYKTLQEFVENIHQTQHLVYKKTSC